MFAAMVGTPDEGFSAWKHDFIEDGKDRWGGGMCWGYLEDGDCDPCFGCRGHRPVLTIGPSGIATMSHNVPEWQRKLQSLGFQPVGSTGGSRDPRAATAVPTRSYSSAHM